MIQEQEEEEQILPVECFTVPVDWSHLQRLKGAQYWYVPARMHPEEVDASLSIDKGTFSFPMMSHSTSAKVEK